MKKRCFIFSVLMSLAVGTTLFAGPFADVPIDHWAYKAVNQLAEKGIVIGRSPDAFCGGETATRYEIAMIVAKALAKSDLENSDSKELKLLRRLSDEFADELALLGIKVSDLEKEIEDVKSDLNTLKDDVQKLKDESVQSSVTIGGDMLIRHEDQLKGGAPSLKGQFTSAAFRLRFSAKIDEKVNAVVRSIIYADEYGTKLGGAAGTSMPYYRTLANKQCDVDEAYLNIKDVLNGNLLLGRSFYFHGSALVMNGYVDAIRYSIRSGNVNIGLNAIQRDVVSGTKVRKDRYIWNLNLDSDVKGHKLYAGYYTQKYEYAADYERSILELGSKGKIDKQGKVGYDLGFVATDYDAPAVVGRESLEGKLYHLSLKYDVNKEWSLKAAYSSGDDEYESTRNVTLNGGNYMFLRHDIRTFGGPETPFDDFLYVRPGMSMRDAELVKIQTEFKPMGSKHAFRIAYDMYDQDKKCAKRTSNKEDDEANVLTVEYIYKLSEHTNLRAGYYTLDDDTKQNEDDDSMFIELYTKF